MPKTATIELDEDDLNILVITLLLHQNARMAAMAQVPGPSSNEMTAFGEHQEALTTLRGRLEQARATIDDDEGDDDDLPDAIEDAKLLLVEAARTLQEEGATEFPYTEGEFIEAARGIWHRCKSSP